MAGTSAGAKRAAATRRKKRGPVRKMNPCKPTNSTGAKASGSGRSKRAKSFKEDRHPRTKQGKMKQTSAASKKKYGKSGTTKAKLTARCRAK